MWGGRENRLPDFGRPDGSTPQALGRTGIQARFHAPDTSCQPLGVFRLLPPRGPKIFLFLKPYSWTRGLVFQEGFWGADGKGS